MITHNHKYPVFPHIQDCPRCRLDKAAPELLEACKSVWNDIKGLSPSSYVKLETFQKIETVIAKAEKGA